MSLANKYHVVIKEKLYLENWIAELKEHSL